MSKALQLLGFMPATLQTLGLRVKRVVPITVPCRSESPASIEHGLKKCCLAFLGVLVSAMVETVPLYKQSVNEPKELYREKVLHPRNGRPALCLLPRPPPSYSLETEGSVRANYPDTLRVFMPIASARDSHAKVQRRRPGVTGSSSCRCPKEIAVDAHRHPPRCLSLCNVRSSIRHNIKRNP